MNITLLVSAKHKITINFGEFGTYQEFFTRLDCSREDLIKKVKDLTDFVCGEDLADCYTFGDECRHCDRIIEGDQCSTCFPEEEVSVQKNPNLGKTVWHEIWRRTENREQNKMFWAYLGGGWDAGEVFRQARLLDADKVTSHNFHTGGRTEQWLYERERSAV